MPVQQPVMRWTVELPPLETRSSERLQRQRIGHLVGPLEARELLAPPATHGLGELRIGEVGEEAERARCSPLLALEQERGERREGHDGRCDHRLLDTDLVHEAIARGPVAHVVVVLSERDEPVSVGMRHGCAAPASARVDLPSRHECVLHGIGDIAEALVGLVVAHPLVGQRGVDCVVHIV